MLSSTLISLLLAAAPAAPAADEYENAIKELLRLKTEACDLMDKVKDKKTAEDNKAKLKVLAGNLQDVQKRLAKLGAPPKEFEKKLTEQYVPELFKLVPRINDAEKKLQKPEIKEVLGELNLQLK